MQPVKEGFFAKAFRASPHPIGITELDTGRCLEINDACLEIFGFRRNEVIGKTTLMLGIWPDPHDRTRLIERLQSEGSVRNAEMTMRMKTGELRQFLISTDLITLRGKRCLLTIGNDITERKQAEEALRESEQRFRAIYDQTYEFIGLLKPDGTVIDVNRTALLFRELQLEDVVGKPFWLTPWWDISRELQEKLKAAIGEAANGRFVRIKAQHRTQDGAIEDIDVSLTPIKDRSGTVTQIIPEGRRITALTKAQDQLRQAHADLERRVLERTAELEQAYVALQESEERTRAFLDNSATVAWMKDAEGRHVYLSPNFERRFGIRLDDWLGKTDLDLWPREVADVFRANDLAVLKDNHVIEVVEEAPNPDGSRSWWLSHKFPYQDSTGKRFVGGLGVEITDRKLAEDELAERARLSDFAAEASLCLNRDEPLDRLLQRCAETVVGRLPVAFARIWVLGPGDLCKDCHQADWCKDRTQCLHLIASAGLSTNLNGEYRRVPLGALKIGRIAQGAGAMATNDILQDDHLPNKEWMKDNGLCSFAGYPLVVEGRMFGVLAIFGREPLSKVTLQTLESLCNGMATAIARKQAEDTLHQNQRELRRHRAQLQDLTSKLLTAQESERQRIARDLHDDFSQRLAALVLDVASLEQRPPVLPELIPRSLEPIREQLEQLSDDLHNLAYRLHPSLLGHAGLQPTLEDHIHKVTQRTGLRIVLKAREVPGSLTLEQATCLFRVLQESLQNIVKHANATDVTVKLSGSPYGIGLSVIDNGKGFDASDKSAHHTGLGLISMQERLRLLNGFLRIHSRPADGTKVCAWIPFKEGRR